MDRARFPILVISASNINDIIFTFVIVLSVIIFIIAVVVTRTFSIAAGPAHRTVDGEDQDQDQKEEEEEGKDEGEASKVKSRSDQNNNNTRNRFNVIDRQFFVYQPATAAKRTTSLCNSGGVVIPDPNNMIAKLAETTVTINSTSGAKSLFAKDATTKSNNPGGGGNGKNEGQPSNAGSQSKRKRAKLLDQLLNTNWSRQSQQASNLVKLNKMLLVCDVNFLDEKSGESPLSLAISSAQINNASHQMLFANISASSANSSFSSNSNSLYNLQCQVPVQGLGRLELISLQQANITELIQSKAPLIQRILLLLTKSGALIDFRNSDGRTPLHVAAMKSNFWALKTLLDLGASTDYRDINGLTPLYYSILRKADLKVTQLLLSYSRNPSGYGTSSSSGNITTLMSDRHRIQPACTGTTDDHGWQEVHHACKQGLDAHLEALIYYGCDIDAKISGSGNTPLHVAAINDQLNCAKVLLMRGADKTITNNSHQTAHQVAVVSGNMDLAEFIAQHNDSMMVPFRANHAAAPAPSAQKPNDNGRQSDERPFAMFGSRSSANIRVEAQQPSSQASSQVQMQQRHMNPLSLDVYAPTNPVTAASSSSSTTTNSSSQSLLSIGGNRNQNNQLNAHVNNISPCLSQRSCATSNTTTSSGVCCDGDGNQSTEEQQQQQSSREQHHLSNSHSQHSNVTIISIRNGAVDKTHGDRESLRAGGDDDDLRSSSDDGTSNASSSSCTDDLYSLMSEQRPLYAGSIVEAISEYQSGDPSHLQLHRGDLIEVLEYTPDLLNSGQLPRLANKPMVFGRRLSDNLKGLFPSFCVRRAKHKQMNHKQPLRNVTNFDQSMEDSNSQWPIVQSNENNRPLSESQSMASLDRGANSSLGFSSVTDHPFKSRHRELKVTLMKNNNGFGFVLRGAKIDPNLTSSNGTLSGNDQSSGAGKTIIDERAMAENNLISLQYLDEIEPTSVAHQAGLKRGDFLIAVNGQDVRRSSHEQVVHMIRQSGNQVHLTIATPITYPEEQSANQHSIYMSRTLTRNKPEPPKRNPTTTLTRNKTQRVKSMIVQPQRQVQDSFDADKPLPHAPNLESPLSPSGSLNMGRSVSAHLAHFNSVQSLSSSSVVDSQSISSVSTLSADQMQQQLQQQNHESTQPEGGQQQTPTHSSSSTATLTTIAGSKPRAPPKPNLSQLPSGGSQTIYQPAVITTNKRPSPPSMSPHQSPPKVLPANGLSSSIPQPPAPPPPPPPPLPDFSNTTLNRQVNGNKLAERRTSAPSIQSSENLNNNNRLLKKRDSLATVNRQSQSDAPVPTEFGAVAAACAAAANSRLQRQQQMQKQCENPRAAETIATQKDENSQKNDSKEPISSESKEVKPSPVVDSLDNGIVQRAKTEKFSTISEPKPPESKSQAPSRLTATGSLGRKSSAQIIQQLKQPSAAQSQTLRARSKQRPSMPDCNEIPPPPPPLPPAPEVAYQCLTQQQLPDDPSVQHAHHHHHGHPEPHDTERRQQAFSRRSRDEAAMSLNNREEFIRKQQLHQQELIKQQLRQQQLLQQQQQLKIQQQMQFQHQKCCMNANHTHDHGHGGMRYNSVTPKVQHNHEYSQQAFERMQMKQQQLSSEHHQPVVSISKGKAQNHHHHHHHNHNHPHQVSHHHHTNFADSSTMTSSLQQQHQARYHHHPNQTNHLLAQDMYQQHQLQQQAPVMLNHNHGQQRAAIQQQQQYQQRLQQQQMLAERYMPVVYTSDSYPTVSSRDSRNEC